MSVGMDNKLKNLTYEEAYTYYERTNEKGFLQLMLLQGQNNVSEVKKHYAKGIIHVTEGFDFGWGVFLVVTD